MVRYGHDGHRPNAPTRHRINEGIKILSRIYCPQDHELHAMQKWFMDMRAYKATLRPYGDVLSRRRGARGSFPRASKNALAVGVSISHVVELNHASFPHHQFPSKVVTSTALTHMTQGGRWFQWKPTKLTRVRWNFMQYYVDHVDYPLGQLTAPLGQQYTPPLPGR